MESPRIALSQVSRQRPQLGRGWRNQIRGRSLDAVETGYGRVPLKVLLKGALTFLNQRKGTQIQLTASAGLL